MLGPTLLLAALSSACVKHAPRSSDALFPDDVTVIGHRGARALAPENTPAAFSVAADRFGVPFELDVHLCATGEPIVIHDEAVDRTTDGEGFVDELSLDRLQALDAGSRFSDEFAGERLATLDEVLARFGPLVPIDIELKNPRNSDQIEPLAEAVVASIHAAGVADRVLVTSFNPYLLQAVRSRDPDILRGQLTGTFSHSDLSWLEKLALKHLWLNGKARPDVLAVESARLSARYVRRMRRKGYRIIAWTVDDPDEMRTLMDWGVQGIITDDPGIALAVVRERGGGETLR